MSNDSDHRDSDHRGYDHRPVLLEEVITGLNIQPSGIYIDCTFGRGGHAGEILQQLGPEGRLLAMDKDLHAVEAARRLFESDKRFDADRFSIEHGSFATLQDHVTARGWLGKVDGILLDLGVSSPQLDDAGRGFSFRRDGDLDMRMNTSVGESAADWLKTVSEQDLAAVFKKYGEERYAKRIARAVIKARGEQELTRTTQLAEIIADAHPNWEKGKDPATRCFQAIRIFLNDELDELQAILPQTLECLKVGGRLAVISFHSLEDRIVKRFIRKEVRGDEFPPDLPIPQSQLNPRLRNIGKAFKPSEEEIESNPRARSSVLRVAEKIH